MKTCFQIVEFLVSKISFKIIYDSGEQVFTTYTNGINEFSFKIISKQLKIEISSSEKNAEVEHLYLD